MLLVSGANAWFDKPWADEIPIKEQTVRIYDDEVLTLLVVQDGRAHAQNGQGCCLVRRDRVG